MFGAIFYGISLIWERDQGVLHKFLVSPAPRAALVMGRALSSTIRGVFQAVLVYIIAFVMGVQLQFELWRIGGVLVGVMLGAAIFSTFSLVAACIVKSRERFMGIGQVLTMPLFFASNAIYPLSMMPRLAAGSGEDQSAQLPGGFAARADGAGRAELFWDWGRMWG